MAAPFVRSGTSFETRLRRPQDEVRGESLRVTSGVFMQRKVLVTGGAGSSARRCAALVAEGESVLNRQAHLRRQPASLAPSTMRRTIASPGRHLRPACGRRAFETFAPEASSISPRRATSTARSRAARVHRDQRRRHLHAAGGGARLSRSAQGAAREAFRFLHVSTDEVYGSLGDEGAFTETTPYEPSHPTRPPRPRPITSSRPGAHLRLAGDDHQLLQQLRPLSVPREADSADDPQRARWQAAAGLWRRRQRARLALRRGPRAALAIVARGRTGETYNVGGRNERRTSTSCERICAMLDELRPG